MRGRIQDALKAIECEEGVRVLYACESGSRAWGFESADSDYDVRFLYLHPTSWYLGVQPRRDVIERPVGEGLDLSGWDLRKALGLLGKSNPPLLEWLHSPIVYREVESATRRLRGLIPDYYSPVACFHHYQVSPWPSAAAISLRMPSTGPPRSKRSRKAASTSTATPWRRGIRL